MDLLLDLLSRPMSAYSLVPAIVLGLAAMGLKVSEPSKDHPRHGVIRRIERVTSLLLVINISVPAMIALIGTFTPPEAMVARLNECERNQLENIVRPDGQTTIGMVRFARNLCR